MDDHGCLSLFGDRPDQHRLLADHLTAEYRVKTQGRGRTVDEWKQRPERTDSWTAYELTPLVHWTHRHLTSQQNLHNASDPLVKLVLVRRVATNLWRLLRALRQCAMAPVQFFGGQPFAHSCSQVHSPAL